MSIGPNINAALDASKAAVAYGKLTTANVPDNPKPIDKAGGFGAAVSLGQGATGVGVWLLEKSDTIKTVYANPISATQTLKGSVGIFPGMLTTAVGLKKGDKTMTGLGVAGVAVSSGGFKYFEHAMKQSSVQAFRAAPPWIKATVSVASVLYGAKQINDNMSGGKNTDPNP